MDHFFWHILAGKHEKAQSNDFKSKNKNDNNLNNILKYAILNGIYRIDVSCLESGGCSITIDEKKLNNNLHYDDIKKILC